MSEQQYELRITHNRTTCLGEQLVAILVKIKEYFKEGVWYTCDIDTIGDNLKVLSYSTGYPKSIGSTDELINLTKNIEQFLSGVFLLMPTDLEKKINIECYTEDPPFRDTEGSLIEIRTFDTSCFLIYSTHLEVINALAKAFNGKIYYKIQGQKLPSENPP